MFANSDSLFKTQLSSCMSSSSSAMKKKVRFSRKITYHEYADYELRAQQDFPKYKSGTNNNNNPSRQIQYDRYGKVILRSILRHRDYSNETSVSSSFVPNASANRFTTGVPRLSPFSLRPKAKVSLVIF